MGLQPEQFPTTDKTASVVAFWGVNNVKEVFERLIELGAIKHEKPLNVGGNVVVASVKDPWGNIIGLIYNPEFEIE